MRLIALLLLCFSLEGTIKAVSIAGKEHFFCHTWLEYLFDAPIEISEDLSCLENGMVVICPIQPTEAQKEAMHYFALQGGKFILFHLNDEAYLQDTSIYEDATIVYRQYYHPKYDGNAKIKTLPLGYKYDFKRQPFAALKKPSERAFAWSFMGQVTKSDRPLMIKGLKNLKVPHYFHHNNYFMSSDALTTEFYQATLLETKIAPAPLGFVNPDSYRLWESLECGCIPTVRDPQDTYFRRAYGNVPFLVISSWADLKALKELLKNPEALDAKAKECYHWWKALEENLKQSLHNFGRLDSKDEAVSNS
jgi:hypothetical protein